MIKIRANYKLANGLPVVIADLGSTEAVSALVLIQTGSRLEKPTEAGLSHFLEHMVFKGTTTWPTAASLTHFLDSLGADYNAFTSKEVTGFYIKAAQEHLPKVLQLLAEMVWQPRLDADEMAREKEVIVQEINMYEDNPLMYVEDLVEGAMWPGHNLGKMISGTRQSVRALTARQVNNYLQKFYHPQNMLLVVSGKTNNDTKKLVEKYFAPVRQRGVIAHFDKVLPKKPKPTAVVKFKQTEQIQLALSLPSLPLRHRDTLASELLAIILGGNMSSRLFHRLREQEGLCYFIKASLSPYENAGVFTVQAGLDKSRLQRAVKLIREELERVPQELVAPAELNKAKQYLRGKLLLAWEDSASVGEWLAKQAMQEHKLELPADLFRRLNKITARDLRRVAVALIKPQCYTLAMIGPFRDAKPYLAWLK